MSYIDVKPKLLRWAIKRSGKSPQALYKKFPKLTLWIKQESKPTLKQLESFAQAVYVPIGWLFLDKAPVEKIPVPDFRRTFDSDRKSNLSPELMDTLYLCQRRQNWYREHKQLERDQALKFIGSVQPRSDNIIKTAEDIRKTLNFDIKERSKLSTWKEALNQLIERGRSAQILIMLSGIAGNNTRRKLNPKEFRGFALSDSLAPLIFINSADTLSAQMFTIGHELAHLWIDQTAISNTQALSVPNHHIESWCNKVSAELLVPLNLIQKEVKNIEPNLNLSDKVQYLARHFKVSALVILRRLYDIKQLTDQELKQNYSKELKIIYNLQSISKPRVGGGDFFRSLNKRVSPQFARDLIVSTFEGHTAFKESLELLGIKKISTLKRTAEKLGVNI